MPPESNAADLVLFVGHGTISAEEDIPEFLRLIRRGRPASPDLIEEMRRRYRKVGRSPLLETSRAQALLLERSLSLPVLPAMRMWHPFIADVLDEIAGRPPAARPRRICVLPAAPFSVHVYVEATRRALAAAQSWGQSPPELLAVQPWGLQPRFLEAHARLLREALEGAPESRVVFTAHSLPSAVIAAGDPYARQVEACCAALEADIGRPCLLAYQSQGADGGDWLGPTLEGTLEDLSAQGTARVVVAPVGFISDHIETLYDLDVEAQAHAARLGLELHRVAALNTEPLLIEAMAAAVREALG